MNDERPVEETSPDGPLWAAILAAGVGCAALGLAVDLAEASGLVSRWLNLYRPAGDLSGKTVFALLVWGVAWAVLHFRWRGRRIRSPGRVTAATVALVVLASVAVWPPFFGLFEARP